jgi:hypothetical protein
LAAVNFFLFVANGTQVFRIISYQQGLKKSGVAKELEEAKDKVEGAAAAITGKN